MAAFILVRLWFCLNNRMPRAQLTREDGQRVVRVKRHVWKGPIGLPAI